MLEYRSARDYVLPIGFDGAECTVGSENACSMSKEVACETKRIGEE